MNYKQKYNDALERAKGFKTDACKDVAEYIFPELCESEDERIRKGLIKGLSAMRDIHKHQTFSDDAIDINDAISWLEKQGEQKSAWSEEDEEILNEFIESLRYCNGNGYNKQIDWLKFLKYRIQPQSKQEWSEEDEEMKRTIIANIFILKGLYTRPEKQTDYNNMIEWLKSLKPRWKPSVEQLNALKQSIGEYYSKEADKNLESLYDDLKKL